MARLEDDQADRMRYHAAQARMMDEYRTQTGRFDPSVAYAIPVVGFTVAPSPAGDITPSILNDEFARSLGGRHYYEPLEDHTAPTYGGIMRNSATNGTWNKTPPITVASIKEAVDLLKPAEDPQVGIWRARILAGWEKYGLSGQPLDPRTVEHLAHEFAKPIEWPKVELKLKGWTE